MNQPKTVSLLLILLFALASANAQTRRPRPVRRAAAKPGSVAPVAAPSPAATAVRAPAAPVLLAVVNGQNVTTAEIDPRIREEVESLNDKIAEARRQILELQVNTLLLEAEAARRKMTAQQLYDLEVKRKLTEPTTAEINKFIEDNRDAIKQSDPDTMKKDVSAYLLGEKETRLSGDLVNRLRTALPVVKGADVNAATLPPATVLATVAGKTITAAMIDERLRPMVYKLRLSTYLVEKQALDQAIYNLLLLAEANRRNVAPEELVRSEISEKTHQPSETEISKFYAENQSSIQGGLDSVRSQIVSYLQDQEQQKLESALAERLRKQANVRLLISEPETLVQSISVDDDPARGDANAPVTIVEFTDFQCPSCAAMQPILDEVLKSYGNKVRFVVRDFPLLAHANARKAAEAANAANAQGKFFEYALLLFKHQNALDVPSLKKYASDLGLNRTLFDAALDSGKYAAEVRHDIDDGEKYGVDSTPTIFINGGALTVLSPEGLRAAIDKALAATAPKVTAN
ncbi:MAG TPA: thioredoxin domain-containing protein [Pyrinomonadaceae bacterium]|nr:thioredoxin domain-containing protein [Pyrinomonadaceae bacterium]